MIFVHDTKNGPMVVGTKQTLKALQDNSVTKLFVAKDASHKIIHDVIELAKVKEVPIFYIETMELLGKTCEVQVKTATAALINQV
jgi:large subunit ribosomal protein L7A